MYNLIWTNITGNKFDNQEKKFDDFKQAYRHVLFQFKLGNMHVISSQLTKDKTWSVVAANKQRGVVIYIHGHNHNNVPRVVTKGIIHSMDIALS